MKPIITKWSNPANGVEIIENETWEIWKKIKYTGKNVVAKPESLLPCFNFLPPSLLSSSSIHPVLHLFPQPPLLVFPPVPLFFSKPSPTFLFMHQQAWACNPPYSWFPGRREKGAPHLSPVLPGSSNAIYKKTKILWLPKWGLQTRWPIIVSFISRFKSFYFGIFIMYCNISIFILQV